MIFPDREYTWGTGKATYLVRVRGDNLSLVQHRHEGKVINKTLPSVTLMRHLAEAEGYTGFRYVEA